MSEQDLMLLKEMLLNRRREIFDRLRQFESNWKTLQEREIEEEEEAQKADLTSLYDHLDGFETAQIEAIDLALFKMAVGKFGVCESCKKAMSLKRLKALPEARLCRRCAGKFEEKQRRLPPSREVIAARVELPPEYRNLDDEELGEAILEEIRYDGRIDRHELNIICRKGVVFLEGVLPSENEHQILLRILTERMGFTAIIDHLGIDRVIWERLKRAPGRADFPVSVDAEEITEDVFKSQEEGKSYMFPDRPPSEKE